MTIPTEINPQLADAGIDAGFLDAMLEEHLLDRLPRLERLWDYYRNDLTDLPPDRQDGYRYQAAQACGLSGRLTAGTGGNRRELVIENDIAWRVHALVDFMFGKPFAIGLLWVWERMHSRRRERQLSEAHDRILGQRESLDVLCELVRQSTRATERFERTLVELDRLLNLLLHRGDLPRHSPPVDHADEIASGGLGLRSTGAAAR